MGIWEKWLLIGVLKWIVRWLTSNEKNDKKKRTKDASHEKN